MSLNTKKDVTPISNGYSQPNPTASTDWSAYSSAYDLLSMHNPAYQELMQNFSAFLATIEVPQRIYDIGGGTGNYTEIAARACPDSEIHLIEPDTAMIQSARSKLAEYDNISFHNLGLEDVKETDTCDLAICVHALYAMPEQVQRLADLHRLLKPGGYLYLIDLGRRMNVADWRKYLLSELKKRHGLAGALRIFWQGREVAKQNKAICAAQERGAYWTHSAAELVSAASGAGFEIISQKTVYRGYSDLLVCRAK
ncbi:class I SAM-dependent methyltransferase [Sulfitobacter sp. KE37]|uniref:class I SAM-dependent methyltransferase n=1 Tax=unclassified Sulfitobacter TaxID=196795 RepID=UPI0023E20368|nr:MULTISPECIES: class I SAM-dependent methyltransferase [unclassified Sulfitobacter]MDF3352145.1 class I SAM-dependent methyltransferase [Sulfitobacter sp. KE12]MDF3355700.1 class I SAM-dependent methyltransferase [Sulfitobacter sp. KE27]MDF3370381.1 class I SAM-dependent methyltransferase [Sulfitobacter sp. Ks43]MDF3374033.1 class I SAM-dependent methyltransferase [Sulfitobacter sp. KS8]MDF3377666.1 class I SAM-dependent methyltransferase [Sulfitobacter sp. KE37]